MNKRHTERKAWKRGPRWLRDREMRQGLGWMAAAFVIILVAVFVLEWALTEIDVLPQSSWNNLEGFASAGALAFTVAAGVFVLHQLEESVDSRNLGVYQDIYDKMMNPEQSEARRRIYLHVPAVTATFSPADVAAYLRQDTATSDAVRKVLIVLDYFGFLVEQEWVSKKEIIGWMSPIVVKLWVKIGPVLEYERSQRPEEPDYYESAEYLYNECRAWRQKTFPNLPTDIEFSEERR